jgi:hypothetical protein
MDISRIRLFNQPIWDTYPDRAENEMCRALLTGGFGEDLIRREVDGYEGQIMAIRAGLVDRDPPTRYGWTINDKGRAFLHAHGKVAPTFLPVIDSWHSAEAQFCMYETTYHGVPALKFAKSLIPQGSHLCMDPLFRREDAEALRDYITEWLSRLP